MWRSGNCSEFDDCGEPVGGETSGVGETGGGGKAGGGGEPRSRSTLKLKLSRLDC